jgi:hypothetical protein
MNALSIQLGLAAVVPLAIEALKNSRLPGLGWINQGTVVVSRLLSLLCAAAAAAGLVVEFDGSLLTPGTLTIANLGLWTAARFSWELVAQFSLQELAYRAAVQPTSAGRFR